MIARQLYTRAIQNNQQIMTSLSHAFCYLIGSVEDINASVVQKATLFLETIKDAAVKVQATGNHGS